MGPVPNIKEVLLTPSKELASWHLFPSQPDNQPTLETKNYAFTLTHQNGEKYSGR